MTETVLFIAIINNYMEQYGLVFACVTAMASEVFLLLVYSCRN